MLHPLGDDDWPDELSHLKDGFMGQANVWRVMAHNPALVVSLQDFRNHIVLDTAPGPSDSEVVILRIAYRLDASYEWAHHVVRAREKGWDDRRIRSMRGPAEEMTAEDAPLARAVDALIDHAKLPPDLTRTLAERFGTAGVLDLIATTGFYLTLGFALKSFDTPVDRNIAEALERDPLD